MKRLKRFLKGELEFWLNTAGRLFLDMAKLESGEPVRLEDAVSTKKLIGLAALLIITAGAKML